MAQQILITVTQGSESKGLRLKQELVELFGLESEQVRDYIRAKLSAVLFDTQAVAELINDNLEDIS